MKMKDNLKKMISYYHPYMRTFVIDMIFAFLSAAITLVLPLIIRYVTSEVIYMEKSEALHSVFSAWNFNVCHACPVLLQ